MITLGPFIITSTHPDTPDEKFRHTGYSMEIVCDDTLFQLPIYRDSSHINGDHATFSDFYFPEPENGWPVEFTFRWFHDKPLSTDDLSPFHLCWSKSSINCGQE